ncbi:MAG: hypothetical protein DBX47_05930 [Clostridiales bacterium]|nr:MAG: hypothetical protein DBX47_05930 [Clostridiales bacterium]
MIKLTTRTFVKIISLTLAVILVLGGFAIQSWYESRNTRYVLSSAYQKNIAEVAALSETLLSSLQKLEYAKSAYQFVTLVSQIRSSAEGVKTAFEQLPGSETGLKKTSSLLSVTADYAFALAKKMLSGDTLTEDESSNLKKLTSEVYGVCKSFLSAEEKVLDENPNAQALTEMFKSAEDIAEDAEPTGFAKIESDIQALPTLIYDGPFSEGNMNKESVFLPGKDPVTEEKAQQICAYALNVSQYSPQLQSKVDYLGQQCYYYNFGTCDAYITEAGGYVKYLSNARAIEDAAISFEEAVSRGKSELEKLGYKNMKETYYIESGNVLVVNYAYVQNDVMCYTDLIKVGVALDNGEAVFIDASNYLLNHNTTRKFETAISAENAATKLNLSSAPSATKKTFIPTDGGGEVFCYEFLIDGENDALVYINAQTGREEKILILLQNDNGTLVY